MAEPCQHEAAVYCGIAEDTTIQHIAHCMAAANALSCIRLCTSRAAPAQAVCTCAGQAMTIGAGMLVTHQHMVA